MKNICYPKIELAFYSSLRKNYDHEQLKSSWKSGFSVATKLYLYTYHIYMLSLVDTNIQSLLDQQYISHIYDIDISQHLQPASIDIPIWSDIYHVKQAFLPFQKSVQYITNKLTIQKFDAQEWVVLYKWQTYLIPCLDLNLPQHLFWKISPKSSLGRIDVLIRAVCDDVWLYDTIPSGHDGQLRLEVTPQSFNIRIYKGTPLSQLMLFDISQWFEKVIPDEAILYDRNQETLEPLYYQDQMIISAGIWWYDKIWYRAKSTDEIIDLSDIWWHQAHRFFEEVYITGSWDHDKLHLQKDMFYILPTKEQISVPTKYAIELVPSTHLMWELRVHYAGFFDPWFGWATGATGVLEIRPYTDVVIYDGQPICLMDIYTNTTLPAKPYGHSWSNYHMQNGPKLAKYFG